MPHLIARLTTEPAPLAWLERQTWHPWLVVGLVSMGAFIGQLDATIVQLALPTLGHQFDASLQHVSWIALSYLAAFVAFLPIFGRLCEMFGRKTLYIFGYLLFIAASALCGFASSFEQLVIFRFLQGMGGSLLGANSISILVKTVSPAQRGRALGWFAAAQAVGMSAGPVLGGLLLETLGWRWIFWLTVPVGALAIVLGWLALPRSTGVQPDRAFDWGGALLIGPALILTVTVLNYISTWGLGSPTTLGSFAMAALLLGLLVRRERSFAAPLIDPALLRSLAFCSAAVGVTLGYALLFGMFFLMSFAQGHGFGEPPGTAGLHLAIIPVAIGLTAPFSNTVKERLSGRWVGPAGMALSGFAVALLFSTLGRVEDHRLFDAVAYALFGAGIGLFIAPNNQVAIAAVSPALSGPAGSLLNLMRALGTSLGVAGGATMLAFNLESPDGAPRTWLSSSGADMLIAVRHTLPLLGAIAVLAGLAAWFAARKVECRNNAP
ncbi:EmrB/QacA subfamily drug resistance transporter [Ancylobacter aquaticus]|uniref:EmrB/QacA subfamily drug resistance transporter n=1 Tax=Ancylobacter aquaticus TaxID=100 RepID=A0A4R1IAI3_ANCAQ|nr:MFS transporter [Ancylobacter aquaticus]TCK30630.1 EmrB/QacA subfamily drug resistance transporter [Ancylobacter aquaticus]